MKAKYLFIVFFASFILGVLLWLSMWGVYREHLYNADVFGNSLRTGSVCGVLNVLLYAIMKKTTEK